MAVQGLHVICQILLTVQFYKLIISRISSPSTCTGLLFQTLYSFPWIIILQPLQNDSLMQSWKNIYLNLYPTFNQKTHPTAHIYIFFSILISTTLDSNLKQEEHSLLIMNIRPCWCGSVDRVPTYKPKGHQFHSQSGHMPGLQARSPAGGTREATTH